MERNLEARISENQPAALKNRTILHTLSIICHIVNVPNKPLC